MDVSESQVTEDPKSQAKKRKRNKRKKNKGAADDKAEDPSDPKKNSAGLEDPIFTPLKDKIPDSFFED